MIRPKDYFGDPPEQNERYDDCPGLPGPSLVTMQLV